MAEIPLAGGAASERPLGVTILAILSILGGLIMLAGGAFLVALGIIYPLSAAIGVVLLILGLLDLLVGYGLWTLKSWAWTWAMIVNILSIILSIVQFNIYGLIIPLIIVIYLNSPDIKSRFR